MLQPDNKSVIALTILKTRCYTINISGITAQKKKGGTGFYGKEGSAAHVVRISHSQLYDTLYRYKQHV